jgi:hypothetical protein
MSMKFFLFLLLPCVVLFSTAALADGLPSYNVNVLTSETIQQGVDGGSFLIGANGENYSWGGTSNPPTNPNPIPFPNDTTMGYRVGGTLLGSTSWGVAGENSSGAIVGNYSGWYQENYGGPERYYYGGFTAQSNPDGTYSGPYLQGGFTYYGIANNGVTLGTTAVPAEYYNRVTGYPTYTPGPVVSGIGSYNPPGSMWWLDTNKSVSMDANGDILTWGFPIDPSGDQLGPETPVLLTPAPMPVPEPSTFTFFAAIAGVGCFRHWLARVRNEKGRDQGDPARA